MRTLLLASNSYVVHQQLPGLLDKTITETKIAFIITGSKAPDIDDLDYVDRARVAMTEMGCQFEEIDIMGMTEAEVRKALSGKDIIYVTGGNTCYILKAARQNNFGKVVEELMEKGVVYIGASAGTYLTCPTVEMFNWRIKEKQRPKHGLTDLTGLNWVPFLIKVHYLEEERDLVKKYQAKTKLPVRVLKDGQAFLVKDDKIELVGEGEEVIL